MATHTPHVNDTFDPEIVGASSDEHHRPLPVFSSASLSAVGDSAERRAATQERF
jgi:hypothetical protein